MLGQKKIRGKKFFGQQMFGGQKFFGTINFQGGNIFLEPSACAIHTNLTVLTTLEGDKNQGADKSKRKEE